MDTEKTVPKIEVSGCVISTAPNAKTMAIVDQILKVMMDQNKILTKIVDGIKPGDINGSAIHIGDKYENN